MKDQAQVEEDINNESEASLDRDFENSKNTFYASDEMPTDMFRYKRMRLVPDSQAEFRGLLDKDVVLANVQNKKPDPDYLRVVAETIVAFQGVFCIEKEVEVLNTKGFRIPIMGNDGKVIGYKTEIVRVFDPNFQVIEDFLRATFKSELTLSRAMGNDREAVLDRTQNIGKEIKKNSGNQNKYGG